MASSQPTSSPTRSASPDRFDLTPHSRLRQLLATVESDSDGENTPKKPLKQPKFTRLSSPASDQGSRAQAASSPQNGEDENDGVGSQGRIAGRMQGVPNEAGDDARERVRKLLEKSANAGHNSEDNDETAPRPRGRLASRMQGAPEPLRTSATTLDSPLQSKAQEGTRIELSADVEMSDVHDDEEDEDIHVRRRKPAAERSRNKTPESTARTPQQESSPGLFVTPSKSPRSAQNSTGADTGDQSELLAIHDRFKKLVQKRMKERLAREAEEAWKRGTRAAALEELGDDKDDDVSNISDDDGGRKLTQTQKQSRPSRKASKKAQEEMNRETQRMQRAMQLAHEAKTKKKISKASLFERFNYNPVGDATKEKQQDSSHPPTPSSTKSTDAEMQDAETPPSSPPARVQDILGKDLEASTSSNEANTSKDTVETTDETPQDDDDLPDIFDMQALARKPFITAKDVATTPVRTAQKRHVRVKLPPIQANRVSLDSDNEDDLIVVDKKRSKLDALFDRVPKKQSKESSSLRMLRQLAHLDSPERKAYKRTDKSAMTPGELQAFLRQQAREQAKLERERRLESLKAKGIHMQTEEERQRDNEQIEDMVARARREAEEIMDREMDEAKLEKKSKSEDLLAWEDSGSDDDYVEDKTSEDDVEPGVEFSGSEEDDNEEGSLGSEDEDDGEKESDQTPKQTAAIRTPLDDNAADVFDNEASETEQSWVDPDEEEERHRWGKEDESMDATPAFVQAMRPAGSFASIPDNRDLEVEATPKPSKTYAANFTPKPTATKPINFTPGPKNDTSPEVPTSVLRSAAKTFIPGLPIDAGGPAGLGLTQIFAGTMDDSQVRPPGGSPSQLMPSLDNFPDSQCSQKSFESADAMILDSQPLPTTQENRGDESQLQLEFSQSQTHGLDSLLRDHMCTQSSEFFDPTQDNGFQKWTPLKERFVEPPMSTVDTVIRDPSDVEEIPHDSPLLQKRSRLRRKAVIASDSEDDGSDGDRKPSAFRILKNAAAQEKKRKTREEFNRKKSKAKEMVEEQAEESEDEYAGLGGVDGEDSDNDDAASVHEMIDDQTQGNMDDEVKIAALHAERQRVEDAKQTDKLFHDITRGMLRRKRGADYDLSDSDDGGEARRRMKRRQFAKMQKMLMSDERVSKVAENPRNQAFLRTIEDIGSDEEMDFLFEPAPRHDEHSQLSTPISGGVSISSQGNEMQETVPDSQPTTGAEAVSKTSAAARRTNKGRKPANIGEIRETLSSLLDEPSGNTVVSATDFGSDGECESDGESSNKENANPRRRRGGAVVDRISLKRQGSSNASNASNGGNRMAFAAPTASANGGFNVPALLRKATTNSLMSSGSSNGATGGNSGGSAGGFGDEAKIKKNAGKRSGISYLARETDRRAKLEEAEKRREAKKFKAVEGRSRVVGGLFGAGKFE